MSSEDVTKAEAITDLARRHPNEFGQTMIDLVTAGYIAPFRRPDGRIAYISTPKGREKCQRQDELIPAAEAIETIENVTRGGYQTEASQKLIDGLKAGHLQAFRRPDGAIECRPAPEGREESGRMEGGS